MTGSTRLPVTAPGPAAAGPDGGASHASGRAPRTRERLVRRLDAERYMRVMLLGFAGSVLGTRAYLAATGYPQVGETPCTSPTPCGVGWRCSPPRWRRCWW